MIKVGVLGARGRMGQTVCETIEAAPDTELGAEVDPGDALHALLFVTRHLVTDDHADLFRLQSAR